MISKWMSKVYLCTKYYIWSILHSIKIFLIMDKIGFFFVHKYILLIQLDVMDNFCDEQ